MPEKRRKNTINRFLAALLVLACFFSSAGAASNADSASADAARAGGPSRGAARGMDGFLAAVPVGRGDLFQWVDSCQIERKTPSFKSACGAVASGGAACEAGGGVPLYPSAVFFACAFEQHVLIPHSIHAPPPWRRFGLFRQRLMA